MRRIGQTGQPDYTPVPQRRADLLTPGVTDRSVSDEIDADIDAHEAVGTHTEIKLTPQASSSGPEGTIFYNSADNHVYVGTE